MQAEIGAFHLLLHFFLKVRESISLLLEAQSFEAHKVMQVELWYDDVRVNSVLTQARGPTAFGEEKLWKVQVLAGVYEQV